MKNLIKVKRRTKCDCLVCIMLDRATDKYCYVNLTSRHVCKCRFDTFEEALADLLKREDVLSYEFFKDGDLYYKVGSIKDPYAEFVKGFDISKSNHIKERDEYTTKDN